LIYVILNSNN